VNVKVDENNCDRSLFSSPDATPVGGRTAPDFGKMYHVKGAFLPDYTVYLPYAEIKEPFEAWYDLKGNRGRIDFYHGQSSSDD